MSETETKTFDELREIIEYLLVRLEEENADDCDCGTDEPGSCVICRAKAVLSGGGDERWVLSERGHKIICEDGKLRKPTPGQIGLVDESKLRNRIDELVLLSEKELPSDTETGFRAALHMLEKEIILGRFSVSGAGTRGEGFQL